MPEISPILAGLTVGGAAIGAIIGWFLRGSRVGREKAAIHASWKEQIGAQNKEHDRIVEQNKSLMEQISQYRTAKKEADARAKELAGSLKEALDHHEDMQKQVRELRSNLEITIKQRDRLKQDADGAAARDQSRDTAMREKDEKIFNLSRELESWQDRLPPLLEKYRQRDLEAQQLEIELQKLSAQLADGDGRRTAVEETRAEAMDDTSLAARLDASNEQYDEEAPTAPAVRDEPAGSNGRLPADDPMVDELTAIEALLDEGTVDFDLGETSIEDATDDELSADAAIEQSIVDVFAGDGTVAEVDELLDAGSAAEPADAADREREAGDDDADGGTVAESDELRVAGDAAATLGGADADREGGDEDGAGATVAEPDELRVAGDAAATLGGADADREGSDEDGAGATVVELDELRDAVDEAATGEGAGRDAAAESEDARQDVGDERADEHRHQETTASLRALSEAPSRANGHQHDDLQRIKGVGPAIEKTLNDLGIFRFDQIAGMSEVEIDRVASELRGFRSRIYREDWIGQARMLLNDKASQPSR
jgi:predicted flap endonuclease-1-like 5' DNA nuclease